MKKLFLDSNIWLHFFLKDNPEQYQSIEKLLIESDAGGFQIYTSSVILLEINFVLKGFYKLTLENTLVYLQKIKDFRNITIIDKTNSHLALEYYKTHKIKFSDCLIASQIRKDIILVTHDQDFKKIPELTVKTPDQLV